MQVRPDHVVPTMLDGARLPSELPHELSQLYRAQRLDLRPADSRMGYGELLGDVFMKAHCRRGRPIIITDGSDHAEVYLDRLAHQLKSGLLGLGGVAAVTAVTRGFAAVSLREASAQWPDVIILRHPGADEEKLAALERGVRRNAVHVVQAGTIGGAGGVTFEIGRTLLQPPAPLDRSFSPDLAEPRTSSAPSSPPTPRGNAPGHRSTTTQVDRATPRSTAGAATPSAKTGLGLAAKIVSAGLVAVAVAVGATVASPSLLSPFVAAPTPAPPPRGPAAGGGTVPSGGSSPGQRPSIMPTACSTDPFWGTNGHPLATVPGRSLECFYDYKNTTGLTIARFTVYDGTTPLEKRAQEVKDGGQKVQVDGTDAAWFLDSASEDLSRMLISSGKESLFMIFHGSSADGIAAAKRLLHLG